MSMLLLPQETLPNEQPLLADWHISAGHNITRQTADVAAIAQNRLCLPEPDRAKGGKRQGTANPQARVQRERPRGHHAQNRGARSEEHTSELQSLMRNSYAVF